MYTVVFRLLNGEFILNIMYTLELRLHLHFILFIFLNQNHNLTKKAVLKTTFFGKNLRGTKRIQRLIVITGSKRGQIKLL